MTTYTDNEQNIISAMADNGLAGLSPLDLRIDDVIHRFKVEGDKPGSKNGWYVFFGDGVLAGCYGSWRTSQSFTYCAKPTSALTATEKRQRTQAFAAATKQREQAQRERQEEAAQTAHHLLTFHPAASPKHPYLKCKRVKPHSLRQDGQTLLVPLWVDGLVTSLQYISPAGSKYFLAGGRIKGAYHAIGEYPSQRLIVCEGFATGATLHESTGHTVWCAMAANNLLPVAQAAREHYGDIAITIAADNDEHTEGNPGVTQAKVAAAAIGATLSIPPMAGDFNDLAAVLRVQS